MGFINIAWVYCQILLILASSLVRHQHWLRVHKGTIIFAVVNKKGIKYCQIIRRLAVFIGGAHSHSAQKLIVRIQHLSYQYTRSSWARAEAAESESERRRRRRSQCWVGEKVHVFFISFGGLCSSAPWRLCDWKIRAAGIPVRYEYYYNKCPIQSILIHGQHGPTERPPRMGNPAALRYRARSAERVDVIQWEQQQQQQKGMRSWTIIQWWKKKRAIAECWHSRLSIAFPIATTILMTTTMMERRDAQDLLEFFSRATCGFVLLLLRCAFYHW